jgi:hypothetical protein
MLLCSFHHHRLDANGWEVFLKHGTPSLRPRRPEAFHASRLSWRRPA